MRLELKRKLLATIDQPEDMNVIGFTRGEEDRLLDLQEHFPEQVCSRRASSRA